MPVCPQCDNRQFSNKEALLQHMKSSSAYHPFCGTCDRRFVSETAFEAHMAAKHPPTFDCTMCDRKYHALFALEDHYRGSNLHPNCSKCGKGFRDIASRDEHQASHPKTPCIPCGGKVIYDDALEQHYLDSPNHPACHTCSLGFFDQAALTEHYSLTHSGCRCDICDLSFDSPEALDAHFWAEPTHPKCRGCSMGFKDDSEREKHLQSAHHDPVGSSPIAPISDNRAEGSPLRQESNPAVSYLNESETYYNSTGFTPLSPERRFLDLIAGDRKMHSNSPDLRLEMAFASPLQDVKPLMSPISATLPRPGARVEELWSSTQNVQVSPVRVAQSPEQSVAVVAPRASVWSSPLGSTSSHLPNRVLPPSGDFTQVTNGTYGDSAPRFAHRPLSPTSSASTSSLQRFGTRLTAPSRPFFPQSASTSSLSGFEPNPVGFRRSRPLSPPRTTLAAGPEFNSRLYPGSARFAARVASHRRQIPGSQSDFTVLSGRAFGSGPRSHIGFSTDRDSSTGSSVYSATPNGHSRAPTSTSEHGNWADLVDDQEDMKTPSNIDRQSEFFQSPRMEAQDSGGLDTTFLHSHMTGGSQTQNMATSPSMATTSSPPLSALAHSPGSTREPETRPTTASSTRTPSLNLPVYITTASDGCPSPHSPEVISPTHLGALPVISPLVTTPIDLATFDLPEARMPLPESPTEATPPVTTVNLDIATQTQEPPIPTIPPAPPSESYITSPREPASEVSPVCLLEEPQDPDEKTPPAMSSPDAPKNPLHCRVCLAETCDDITASMCGHIFCNRCITQAVINTSRCPVCSTPTLLYCLFRLDLGA